MTRFSLNDSRPVPKVLVHHMFKVSRDSPKVDSASLVKFIPSYFFFFLDPISNTIH